MRKEGFAWGELIIVIACLALIVLIALPNYTKSRSGMNETLALKSIREIYKAENLYASTYDMGYTPDLATLGPPTFGAPNKTMAGMIDDELAKGVKAGYRYTYTAGPADSMGKITTFTITAVPESFGSTGSVSYFVDQTGMVHESMNHPATASDTALGM